MGSRGKEEQQRVKALLADTVTLLCKNGLSFKKNLKVQGLLGVTVDDDEVFIVHLNETMGDLVSASDPDQTEIQSPSKQGQSGRRSPKRKRRRRSTDSNKSKEQEEECIDLDPDIEIKTEPDMLVVDELKYEGTPSKQSCRYPDEGLNFAIGSISSQNMSFPGGTGDTGGGGAPPNTTERFNPLNTSATDSVTTSTGHQPFVTGMIPNVADTSNQSSADGSFQWDSHAAQGVPGMSNWASQLAQQTMSQSDMSQQPGPSQGYSPAQRTGTNNKCAWDPNCPACRFYIMSQRIYSQRRQLKRRGVPKAELPVVENKIPPDQSCLSCRKRKAYNRKIGKKSRVSAKLSLAKQEDRLYDSLSD